MARRTPATTTAGTKCVMINENNSSDSELLNFSGVVVPQ
jgi:hypothetical protein